MQQHHHRTIAIISIPVIVAALGYFVDIYDLLLFAFIRISSLKSFGFTQDQSVDIGLSIMSWQMCGLLLGGFLWGIMGDKKGRMSVLFGSIILYSLANIANGFVVDVMQYKICRFIAGIGLAGELGAGITLVCELVPKEKRGLATSFVAGVGLTGALLAYSISKAFSWQTCFFIGGGLGLLLLTLRIGVFESGMFKQVRDTAHVKKGSVIMFFNNRARFKKYMLSIAIGLPTWYAIGILIQLSDKFGKQFGIKEKIVPGTAMLYAYIAISIADFSVGIVSQVFKSRKKALNIFYAITITSTILFFCQSNKGSASGMYVICALIGFGTGFWALFVTMAAEHFGTNLRATATTTAPNMVRGSLVPIALLFGYLQGYVSFIAAGAITGVIVMSISVIAVFMMDETYGRDLNFIEE